MKRVRAQGAAFRTLVRTYACGTDPSLHHGAPGAAPSVMINTVALTAIHTEGGKAINGSMVVAAAGVVRETGTFRVADNDFTTRAELILGDYRLLSNVDFLPGAGVNDTATAIAATIAVLPGFTALAVAADVTVRYDGTADIVEFKAIHYGTHTNFTLLVPATGFLATGSPAIGAPVTT